MLCARDHEGEGGMKGRVLVVGILALALGGCEYRHKKAIEKIGSDEEVLRKVGATVNEVLRNASDCEVAKPLLTEAYQRIEDARRESRFPQSPDPRR
jgi:hypothetical protein